MQTSDNANAKRALKEDLASELHLSHAAGASNSAEVGRSKRRVRIAVVDVVEDVVELGAELQACPAADWHRLHERQIGADEARPAQHVAWRVAEGELRRQREGRLIEA